MFQVLPHDFPDRLGEKGQRASVPFGLFRLRFVQKTIIDRGRVRHPREQGVVQGPLHGDPRRRVHLIRREQRDRVPQQEEDQEDEDDLHRGANLHSAGKFPDRFEPGRSGFGTHRPDHRLEQTGHAGLVPKLQGQAEKVHEHGEKSKSK